MNGVHVLNFLIVQLLAGEYFRPSLDLFKFLSNKKVLSAIKSFEITEVLNENNLLEKPNDLKAPSYDTVQFIG